MDVHLAVLIRAGIFRAVISYTAMFAKNKLCIFFLSSLCFILRFQNEDIINKVIKIAKLFLPMFRPGIVINSEIPTESTSEY